MMPCGKCKRPRWNGGTRRLVHLRDGGTELLGLCPECTAHHDLVQHWKRFGRTALGFVGLAIISGLVFYKLIVG